MKLSWRDLATTSLMIGGGAIVYAKFYDYSWALIESWRSAVAVIAGAGVLMVLLSAFDVTNRSILNVGEMIVGAIAATLAVIGMIVTSEPIFFILAATIGTLWLVDTARHLYHSLAGTHPTHNLHVPAH